MIKNTQVDTLFRLNTTVKTQRAYIRVDLGT